MHQLAIPTALVFATMATPVLADIGFNVPEGCEAFLTVQATDCTSSLYWRCDIAPAGDRWEANFDSQGLSSIVTFDDRLAIIDATYMWDASREEAMGTPLDPTDLDVLLETGTDSFDFQMRRDDDQGTRTIRYTGADRLTGDELVVSGVRLLRADGHFIITGDDGSPDYEFRGEHLVAPELRMMFFGKAEVTDSDGSFSFDSTPVAFLYPEDVGFGNPTPLYGCAAPEQPAPGGQDDKKK